MTVDMKGRPAVAEGLFTWPSDDPHLLGAKCQACGVVTFPGQGVCPRCTSSDMGVVELATRGTLWTWTVQGFPPKSPPYHPDEAKAFQPYGVGYVELPDQVRVEARLTETDPDRLRIGMTMELVIVPFGDQVT